MEPKTEGITSRDNGRLVSARRVRDGRDRTRIFIEGRRLVEEALRSEIDFEECFIAESFRSDQFVEKISKRSCPIFEISEKLFSSIADTSAPQGIVLIARRPATDRQKIDTAIASPGLPLAVFLNEINNPSNLGAVLRTAEAAGILGVIVSPKSADTFSAKAIRASMGAVFRIPIWENADFDQVLEWATMNEFIATASDISATTTYSEIDWKLPRLVIFGSEAHGLTSSELAKSTEKIFIPMENGVESLNLAVSAGVILFEAKRQRA